MESRVDRLTLTYPGTDVSAGYVESATITVNGREFTNQGAYVSPTHLTAYLKGDPMVADGYHPTTGRYALTAYRRMDGTTQYEPKTGDVQTWSGDKIGRYVVTGQSYGFHGTRLYHVEMRLDSGAIYHGKGTGSGMVIRGRRSTRQYVPLDGPQARRRMSWRFYVG